MSSYDALASSYDGLMSDAHYRRRADYLDRILRRQKPAVKTVLDLGCGTGTIAYLLSCKGYEVIAVDASEEMLTQAAAKAADLSAPPPLFLCQDMTRLKLMHPVDAVVSTMDSLNYLTRERDLRRTFENVYRYLRPGGIFLMDVNTPYKLRRMDRQMYSDETEESFCLWRTFFSEKTKICTYQVDLFRLRRDGAWERDYEEHRERAWEKEELERCLSGSGFAEISFTGDLTQKPPRPQEDRWQVRCRRREEAEKEFIS